MRKRSDRKPYDREKRQFLVLYRSFLMRVIDLELLSADADTARLLGQFAALFAGLSYLFTFWLIFAGGGFSKVFLWMMEHFLIATTIAALCLISPLCHAQSKPQASPADNQKRNDAGAEPATPPTPRMSDGHPDLSGVYFPGPMDPDKYALGALNGPKSADRAPNRERRRTGSASRGRTR